uniref:TNFR-Cys domain-containing protein n=1 Tax=Rhinolophus ferrumequinum TaxID=59479 RepID=A0A671FV40_RHIFE
QCSYGGLTHTGCAWGGISPQRPTSHAGQYVSEPCRSPHTLGRCVKCDRGTFTAFPNGLDSCFPCATCSEDQEMVMECTSTRDRICRCKPGHFYELPDFYEFCRRCSR